MPCTSLLNAKSLFASTSSKSTNATARPSQKHQRLKSEEIPFPCPSFLTTALKYHRSPLAHRISIPHSTLISSSSSTSSFACTSKSSRSLLFPRNRFFRSKARPHVVPDATCLASAFAAGFEGVGRGFGRGYVEVLAFQLRRMVRSMMEQSLDVDGSVMIDVRRPELNCAVHIEVQSATIASRCPLMHPREKEMGIVVVALRPIRPSVRGGDLDRDEDEKSGGRGEERGEEEEVVWSCWRWEEMRVAGMRIGWGGDLWLDMRKKKFDREGGMKEVGVREERMGRLRGRLGRWKLRLGGGERKVEVDDKNPLLNNMSIGTGY